MSENPIIVEAITPPQHVYVEEENKFTFTFSESIRNIGEIIVWSIIEERKIIGSPRKIRKTLIKLSDSKQGEITFTFPEALAGAKLILQFAMRSSKRKIKIDPSLTKVINVKRKDGAQEITDVYWSEPQGAIWGIKTAKREVIYRNEYGFLHIHSKGLYGHDVSYELLDDGESFSLDHRMIRDNVVSVPIFMDKVWADRASKQKKIKGGEIKIKARVHPEKIKLELGVISPELLLKGKGENKNPAKSTRIPPVKVIIDYEEQEKPEITQAECSVEFRPNKGYTGEYGFDWIRNGDTKSVDPSYFWDNPFKTIMGKHYIISDSSNDLIVETNTNKSGIGFQQDLQTNKDILLKNKHNGSFSLDTSFGDGKMFRRLTRRSKRLVFPFKDTNTGKPLETHTPIMTIMLRNKENTIKPRLIELDIYLDIRIIPDKIFFKFNNDEANKFMTITTDEGTNEITKNLKKGIDRTTHKLTINCSGEFDNEYTLNAFAVMHATIGNKKVEKKEICGMIRILPNGEMYQHKIKVVLIPVKTLLNYDYSEGKTEFGKNRINQFLGQALTIADIVDLKGSPFSLLKNGFPPDGFYRDCCTQKGNKKVFAHSKCNNLKKYLEDFESNRPQYLDYYKIFYFDEEEDGSGGYYIPGTKYLVCFKAKYLHSTDPEDLKTYAAITPTHELLHALGLPHTFAGYGTNTLFTYQYADTDNIMDYYNNKNYKYDYFKKSLYHWQWQIINPKIR